MNEKRISLRFQINNKLDMKAWKLLEKVANEKKASKNSIIIELIISALKNENSDDELAEHIAELVVTKLGRVTIQREAKGGDNSATEKGTVVRTELEPQADEPEILGEDAIGFLDMFG